MDMMSTGSPDTDPDWVTQNSTSSDVQVGLYTNLWRYFWPVIFVVGLAGNTLTLLVMRRRSCEATSADVYLSMLALADSSVLIVGLDEYFRTAWTLNILEINPWACRTVLFLQGATSNTAIWILVAFTLERFSVVCTPYHRPQPAMHAMARCTALLGTAILKEAETFWTVEPLVKNEETIRICYFANNYAYYILYIRPWIDIILVGLLPVVTIIFCNAMIIRMLCMSANSGHIQSTVQQNVKRTSVMCVSASFAFLFCVLPGLSLAVFKVYLIEDEYSRRFANAVHCVSVFLRYGYHAGNFFLYCLTGSAFRRDLRALVSRSH